MSNNDDKKNDFIDFLKAAGILAVTGYGYYKLLKAIESWEKGQVINYEELKQATASVPTDYSNKKQPIYRNCEEHGKHSEICRNCDKCIACNDGIGDSEARWCDTCQRGWESRWDTSTESDD